MDKRFFSRILIPLALLAVAVLWLLQVIPATADWFTWYSLAWAVTILLTVAGVKFLLDGIFMRSNNVLTRKFTIMVGARFLILALICLTSAIAVPHNLIAPITAIIIAASIVIEIVVTGARKWDAGDNQKVGYKNYQQRKAEETKAENSKRKK